MAIQPYEHGPWRSVTELPIGYTCYMDGKLFLFNTHLPFAILTLSDFFMEKQVHQVGEYDFY